MNFERCDNQNWDNMSASQNWDNGMTMGNSCCNMNCCQTDPVYECPEERVCHRYMCYDVPHIKQCNTRIINHHVYRHTFQPCYTCCEENVVENVFGQRCC